MSLHEALTLLVCLLLVCTFSLSVLSVQRNRRGDALEQDTHSILVRMDRLMQVWVFTWPDEQVRRRLLEAFTRPTLDRRRRVTDQPPREP